MTRKHGGAPEAPSQLVDPDYAKKKRAEDRAFQHDFESKCGPVVIKKREETSEEAEPDPKP